MGDTTARSGLNSRSAARHGTLRPAPVIRVLVAEEVRILRDTLVALLELEDDLEVVAELASGEDIMPAALRHRPDVAVIDIDLPGPGGLTAAIAELRRRLPRCRTLILTGLGRPDALRRALAAHVSGFMVKEGPADALIDAVRGVAHGERPIDSPRPQPESERIGEQP